MQAISSSTGPSVSLGEGWRKEETDDVGTELAAGDCVWDNHFGSALVGMGDAVAGWWWCWRCWRGVCV